MWRLSRPTPQPTGMGFKPPVAVRPAAPPDRQGHTAWGGSVHSIGVHLKEECNGRAHTKTKGTLGGREARECGSCLGCYNHTLPQESLPHSTATTLPSSWTSHAGAASGIRCFPEAGQTPQHITQRAWDCTISPFAAASEGVVLCGGPSSHSGSSLESVSWSRRSQGQSDGSQGLQPSWPPPETKKQRES